MATVVVVYLSKCVWRAARLTACAGLAMTSTNVLGGVSRPETQPSVTVFDKKLDTESRLVVTQEQIRPAGPVWPSEVPGNEPRYAYHFRIIDSTGPMPDKTIYLVQRDKGEPSDVVFRMLDAKRDGELVFLLSWELGVTVLTAAATEHASLDKITMTDVLTGEGPRLRVKAGTISGSAKDGTMRVELVCQPHVGEPEARTYALRWRNGVPTFVRVDRAAAPAKGSRAPAKQ